MFRAARTILLTSVVAALAVLGLSAGSAQAATWESSEQWGQWEEGG